MMDHDGSSPVEVFLICFATSVFFPLFFPSFATSCSSCSAKQEDNRKEHEATGRNVMGMLQSVVTFLTVKRINEVQYTAAKLDVPLGQKHEMNQDDPPTRSTSY